MYLHHFGLSDLPFRQRVEPSCYMYRAGFRDAFNVLTVALDSGEEFLMLTGETGTGKTLLCQAMFHNLPKQYKVVYLSNLYPTPLDALKTVANKLGIPYPKNIDQHVLIRRITWCLMKLRKQNQKVILCLDNADDLPLSILEVLHLLMDVEMRKHRLIQLVLVGDVRLNRVLENPLLKQIHQNVSCVYKLAPLNREAMKFYVAHRLHISGYKKQRLFDEAALDLLYTETQGIAARINKLAHKAMLVAYSSGEQIIRTKHIRVAIENKARAKKNPLNFFRKANEVSRLTYGTFGVFTLLGMVLLSMNSG